MPKNRECTTNKKYFDLIPQPSDFRPTTAKHSNKILHLIDMLEDAEIRRDAHLKNAANCRTEISGLLNQLYHLKGKYKR